jgi:hypothetical protein
VPKVRSVMRPVSKGCSRFPGEKDDCVPRSIANATELPYHEAHAIAKSHGRKDGDTMCSTKVAKALTFAGFKFLGAFGTTLDSKVNQAIHGVKAHRGITLVKLLPYLHTGRYIVEVRGHVFAVVDGDMIDYGDIPGGTSVTGLWKYEE